MELTKGDLLINLSGKLQQFTIPDLMCFNVCDWQSQKSNIVTEILEKDLKKIIVRSSAFGEDSVHSSQAGLYDSILNVNPDSKQITKAVENVIKSYSLKGNLSSKNKVIVQRQIEDVSASGVIFSHELNTGSPYYVINYDDKSGSTESVTSGNGEHSNRTLYIHRDYPVHNLKSDRFKVLIYAVKELESIMSCDELDIEFAIDKDYKPYLFQVRRMTTALKWDKNALLQINKHLKHIKHQVKPYLEPDLNIYGNFSILAQMPDWNPVEMLGRSPKRLDLSLYQVLITNSSWRIARSKMGYFHPDGKELMITLAGQPFIDTRLSFNSFLPLEMSADTSSKLVNSWLVKLKENPQLHDKIEFDVALTCYSFDILSKIDQHNFTFSKVEIDEIVTQYRKLTIDLIQGKKDSSIAKAIADIDHLDYLFDKEFSDLKVLHIGDLERIINYTIQYGIIPFAILARHGFIAKTLFESLGIDKEIIETFYNSVSTVASEFHEDSVKLASSAISKEVYMKKYGHLRPGTYDITSLRYDQMDIDAFKSKTDAIPISFTSSEQSIDKYFDYLESVLLEHEFKAISAHQFTNYISDAIKGREYGKFVFTKMLSMILEIVAQYGNSIGLSRSDISNLDISEIIRQAGKKTDINAIKKKITERKTINEVSNSIRLPQVLFELSGIDVIPFQIAQPNFITTKSVEADLFYLESINNIEAIINKIVLIQNADPGFDFIFNYPIKGLITKYGGSNSHMAIRCAEFGLPAAIGCGEQIFQNLTDHTSKVKLNCLTNQIIKIY